MTAVPAAVRGDSAEGATFAQRAGRYVPSFDIAAVVVGIRETRDRREYNPVMREESGFQVPKPTRGRGRICETGKVALCVLWRVGWFMGLFYVGCCTVWYWLL